MSSLSERRASVRIVGTSMATVPGDHVAELFRHGDQTIAQLDSHIASRQAQYSTSPEASNTVESAAVTAPEPTTVAAADDGSGELAPLALIVHEHEYVDADSLGQYLQAAAETDRGIVVIDGQGQETCLSYSMLYQRACCVAKAFTAEHSKASKQQHRAVLHFTDLQQHLVAFWGCILSRTIPVTVAVPPIHTPEHATVKKLLNVWELLKRPSVVTDHAQALQELGLNPLQLPDLEKLGSELEGGILRAWPSPDDVAFFQLTSGSTGIPKCVQISHRGVTAHAFGSAAVLGITQADISMNWLPLDHVVPLLTCHCADVIRTCTQIMCIPDLILGDPLNWLRLCQKHQVSRTWSPNFGFVLAAAALEETDEAFDLSGVKTWLNAGEQVTGPTIERFVTAAARFGVELSSHVPSFGMAEACTCFTWRCALPT